MYYCIVNLIRLFLFFKLCYDKTITIQNLFLIFVFPMLTFLWYMQMLLDYL